MRQYETVGNGFLVRGCEKTMVQIQKTDAVAESAASHLEKETYLLRVRAQFLPAKLFERQQEKFDDQLERRWLSTRKNQAQVYCFSYKRFFR